jgi:hypothetical protein
VQILSVIYDTGNLRRQADWRPLGGLGQTPQRAAAGDTTAVVVQRLGQFGVDEAGPIAFTVMSSLPTSRASERVKPPAAALDAALDAA